MEGEDHEMSCSAIVSEPATQHGPPKEHAKEYLVSHVLVDTDSEMIDAESEVKPMTSEGESNSARKPRETPPSSNLDNTAENPAIFTPETGAEVTAKDPLPFKNRDAAVPAECRDISVPTMPRSTESLEMGMGVSIDWSTSTAGVDLLANDAHEQNAGVPNKMAFNNILDNQRPTGQEIGKMRMVGAVTK
jgi:hypothetical protein